MSGDAALLPRFFYRALRARWRDQRAEIAALTDAIRPGDVAVDVGANKGSYLPWLARAARPGAVVAFEPQSELAAYLARACRAAGLSNVVVEAAGVSERSGTLALHVPGEGRSSPGATFEPSVAALSPGRASAVPVVSLDEYFRREARRIAAVKVDVEGHELAVLRGAAEVLEKHGPLVVFECEARHVGEEGLASALAFFVARDYEGWFVRRGRLAPVVRFDPAKHQRRSGGRFWDAPDYCNNFVMRRRRG
ncbi:MAG TPA: FkbM family methyltransferase [Thermoanaerobaculia bacterium]|nr:FkbM family methyltransferase [Thermoanaerobaculia bacterium]